MLFRSGSEGVESERVESEHAESEQVDSEFETENDQFHERPRRMTVSEFARPRTVIVQEEEEEEEEEEAILLPELDAHFLSRPPQTGPFSTYRVPVLCMSDFERLPVLMASLLHQRRIWHIDEPLIGIEFSAYDTTISLFVGWLESEVDPGCVLVSIMTPSGIKAQYDPENVFHRNANIRPQ